MSRHLAPADLGPELEARWRALPTSPPARQNWAIPQSATPSPASHRRPCRGCGRPLDPVIPAAGHDHHPLCDVGGTWWTPQAHAQAEAILARRHLREVA